MSSPAPGAPAVAAARSFPWLNLALFVATVFSTLWVGASFAVLTGYAPVPAHGRWPWTLAEAAALGVPFSATLLGILVAHEMGHFVTARRHGVDASWPYFIPLPIGVGTMGAVIRMRGRIPTRDALVDIGASGPIAGAVVAIPLLIYGISLSRIQDVHTSPNVLFGNLSLFQLAADFLTDASHGPRLTMEPQPLLYVLVKKLVFDVGANQDVTVHPVAFAAVIGLFVTALNLVPIGQLDGGHVAYAVLGPRAEKLGRAFGWVLLGMALFSSFTWIVWWALSTRLVGFAHPPVDAAREPLSTSRRVVVILTVLLFLATLTPVASDAI